MPNWCANKLTIRGPEAEVVAFKEKAVGHSPWSRPEELVNVEPNALNFHNLVPIPDEVLAAGYEAAGYDWEKKNWGCMWGANDTLVVDEWERVVMYEFNTAWSPPSAFLEALAKKLPTLLFILEYEELGCGFKGLAKFQGEIKEDHCISL
jgi:hypothetical protein